MSELFVFVIMWCSGACFGPISVHEGYQACHTAREESWMHTVMEVKYQAMATDCVSPELALSLNKHNGLLLAEHVEGLSE